LTQQCTWAKDPHPDVQIIWVRGSGKKSYEMKVDTLYVPCVESYGNILKKTILAAKYIGENFPADLYIRSNVSTYLDLDSLQRNFKKRKFHNFTWGGYVDTCSNFYFPGEKTISYVTGTGIFLSPKLLHEMSLMNFVEYSKVPDDVAISHYLMSKDLSPVRLKRNNLGSTHVFLPTYQIRAKTSFRSEFASLRMLRIDKFYKSGKAGRVFHFLYINVLELRMINFRIVSIIDYSRRNIRVARNYLAIIASINV
jgi:hypothetical protein